ncbi:MAG: hypothetical protein NC828_02300, partial [Candidatus Omnitrophica bacterium]|nr:hypothetical protein [Candidatus Omnitrophota bacterium]
GHRLFGHRLLFVILCLMFGILSGCASINETTKGFLGISTKVLEEGRKEAITKTVNFDYFTGFTKTIDLLSSIGAYIYKKDISGHMIAIYVSEADTTPVGIFFQEIDANKTIVEVSSPSTYAKETIAEKLFTKLEKAAVK